MEQYFIKLQDKSWGELERLVDKEKAIEYYNILKERFSCIPCHIELYKVIVNDKNDKFKETLLEEYIGKDKDLYKTLEEFEDIWNKILVFFESMPDEMSKHSKHTDKAKHGIEIINELYLSPTLREKLFRDLKDYETIERKFKDDTRIIQSAEKNGWITLKKNLDNFFSTVKTVKNRIDVSIINNDTYTYEEKKEKLQPYFEAMNLDFDKYMNGEYIDENLKSFINKKN